MNELVRYKASKALLSTNDEPMKREVGSALVKTGLGAGGIWLVAGALPFVTFPMLLILAVLLGGYLWFTG